MYTARDVSRIKVLNVQYVYLVHMHIQVFVDLQECRSEVLQDMALCVSESG